MRCVTENQRGFALVYGLVVLLLATVGGTALLFLAQRDRIGAADYSQMRSASQAAMTSLRAFEGKMYKESQASVTLLQAYLAKPGDNYLFGTGLSNKEQRINIWDNDEVDGVKSPKYSARILGFDRTTFYITVEGKGYGSNGGVKKVVASYKLRGLGLTNHDIGSDIGLYLGGASENFNAAFLIKGDVFLSMSGSGTSQHFNEGGIIEGYLKTADVSGVMENSKPVYVRKNALIQCPFEPKALFKVTRNAGFTKYFTSNFTPPNEIRVDGDVYVAQKTFFGYKDCIDGDKGGGGTAYYQLGALNSRFTDFDNIAQIPQTTGSYIAGQLGMTSDPDKPFGLNLPSWESGVVKNVSETITGEKLDGWWNDKQQADKLFQDEWLVVKLTSGVSMGGGKFTKKVIILTNGKTMTVNQDWYDCDLSSNTLLIADGSTSLQVMGTPAGKNFRGLVYLTDNCTGSNTSYKFGYKSILYGGIQHAGNAKFNLNDDDTLRIFFNDPIGQSAIQEIVNTGIIVAPGAAPPGPRLLVLLDTKIRPGLESLQL